MIYKILHVALSAHERVVLREKITKTIDGRVLHVLMPDLGLTSLKIKHFNWEIPLHV